jgi:hypothetical protein
MVIRETFSSEASCRVEGTFCPGRKRPLIMADRNQSYNWTYIGFDGLSLNGIGGKKPGPTSFILGAKWLYRFSTEPFFCRASSGDGAGRTRPRNRCSFRARQNFENRTIHPLFHPLRITREQCAGNEPRTTTTSTSALLSLGRTGSLPHILTRRH